jgi:polysaccharide pyruvyl transferase WcaK-like protein
VEIRGRSQARSGVTEVPRTVAVWGHYHGRNLGDELVVATLVDAIGKRLPQARIVAISIDPPETERRHGVPAFMLNPGRITGRSVPADGPGGGAGAPSGRHARGLVRRLLRNLPGARRLLPAAEGAIRIAREIPFSFRSYRLLRGVDTLVIAGSGQLLDSWRGPWDHPLTTFRWGALARLARTTVLAPSVGAGPIDGRLSAFLIRSALARAAYVSARDADTERVLRNIGMRRPIPVCPDMGWAFPFPPAHRPPPDPVATPRVGVNIMSHEDPRYWPRGDAGRYQAYIAKMTDFVARLLAESEVAIFSSQTRSDRLAADDLMAHLEQRGLTGDPRLENCLGSVEEIDELVDVVGGCDYVVAARFHTVLLPFALGIPTLGLAYHPKTVELFAQLGQSDRCLDIDAFDPDELYQAFRRLRADDGPALRTAIHERAADRRAAVEAQFDRLFGAGPPRAQRVPA